ncbi:MAG: TolB family protein [Myxococcales bacterium]|jgi:Tol biopolymer transport system component
MTTRSMIALFLLFLVAAVGCGELDLGGPGDGQSVKFSSGYAFVRDGEIYVADKSDYQAAKRLTDSGANSQPAVSVDGRVIVFVHTDADGLTSLRRVSPAGGDESEIVPASSDRQVAHPALSPTGNLVAFISKFFDGTASLTTVDIDGANEQLVASSSRDASPSFYPDGGSVLVLSGADALTHDEMVKVELSAGVRVSKVAGWSDLGERAVLSPDGSRIAFEMRVDGAKRIFVINESGDPSSLVQVTNTDGNDAFPTWIGNDRIGFASDAGGAWNVYEIDVSVGLSGSAYLTVPAAGECSFGGSL